MPDRFHFSRVRVEELEDSPLPDAFSGLHFEGGLEWLLDQLDVEYDRELLGACTNTKPGEDEPATTYFLERATVDGEREILGCTCGAFRYQQIPKPDHVKNNVIGLESIGSCKHLKEYRKRSREYEDVDDEQTGLADMLGVDDGGDA